MKKILIGMMGFAAGIGAVSADVPGAPNQTWWGVINNHLVVRFGNDNGVTQTYRAYVKKADGTFEKLGEVASAGGTGGQIIHLSVDGSEPATFQVCRVNADGEGTRSADLTYTQTNAVRGTLISSDPFNDGDDNRLINAADGNYLTCFNSKAQTLTWIGADLGAVRKVTGVRFIPRHNRLPRMASGVVQIASESDFSDAVDVCTIETESMAAVLYTHLFETPAIGRYVRWVGQDAEKLLSVAEIEFLNEALASESAIPDGLVPLHVTVSSATGLPGGKPVIGWTDVSEGVYPLCVWRATSAGGPYAIAAEKIEAGTTRWTDEEAALGVRYYYKVQYKNTNSEGRLSDWIAYRRLRRLERDEEDNTKLKDGVTVSLSHTGNEGNATYTSSNAFDGDTSTLVSCPTNNTRLALDFGEGNKVGVAYVRAHPAPNPRHTRLQTARVYATDGDYLTEGRPVSEGGFPFSASTWVDVTCTDPACYRVFYLMRPDARDFFSCLSELELYGWLPSDEADLLLAPVRLTKTVSASGVALAWNACDKATSYRVEKKGADGAWAPCATVTAPQCTYTDENIVCGTSVSYRIVSVAAAEAGGTAQEAVSETFTFVPYLPGNGTGLRAVYANPYTNTAWCAGEESTVVRRLDPVVDFDWQRTSPCAAWPLDAKGIHHFRARWYGKLVVPHDGCYTFKILTTAHCDVGLAIDRGWVINGTSLTTDQLAGEMTLTAGEHDLYLEYYKPHTEGRIVLKWGGAVAEEVIPASQLIPVGPYDYGDWTSVRTFGNVTHVGTVFPPEGDEGIYCLNIGRASESGVNRYLEMARNVSGNFTFSCRARCTGERASGQRFGLMLATGPGLKSGAAVYSVGWSAHDGGTGWASRLKRSMKGVYSTLANWTEKGDMLTDAGTFEIRVKRTGALCEFFYRKAGETAWTVDGDVTVEDFENTIRLGLFATSVNDTGEDVVWEVSDINLIVSNGTLLTIR